jgi:hypothetical protein
LLFFSLARTKLPNYIALEFPALALLTALYFNHVVTRGPTRAVVISAAFVPVTIGGLAIAVTAFVGDNKLGVAASTIVPVLCALGGLIFVGSLIVTVLFASRSTASFAPFVLAASSIVAMDAAVIVLVPVAEAYKPVPRLASIVQQERRPGDVVAIQNTAGGNALLFYTTPPISVLAPFGASEPSKSQGRNPRDVICGAPRVWLVAPSIRPVPDPAFGRRRALVARDRTAVLLLYDGPACKLAVGRG